MEVIRLETPVEAQWRRSLELVSITYEPSVATLIVSEDPSGKVWSIQFNNVQGLKLSTFESAFETLTQLNVDGAFFEFKKSKWLSALGEDELEYMRKSRHFVVCCYDEIVEIASWQIKFLQTN